MNKAVLTATAFGYTNIAWKVYKGLSKPAPDPDRNREFIYLYGRTDPLLTNYKQCLAMIQTKNLNYKRRHSASIERICLGDVLCIVVYTTTAFVMATRRCDE